jgi:hypothetical protein
VLIPSNRWLINQLQIAVCCSAATHVSILRAVVGSTLPYRSMYSDSRFRRYL